MIEIKAENKFKILDASKIEELIASSEGNPALLDKYKCFFNTALYGIWCHNKTFGTKEDYDYNSYNSMHSQFYLNEGYLRLSCAAYGGMSGFHFNENELENVTIQSDKSCMEYTFAYLRDLHAHGIIENPDEEDN